MTEPSDVKSISCEEFQSLLPELLATGEHAEHHAHLERCDLCRALISDVNRIAMEAQFRRGGEERP
jgi:hypothetical protein